MSRKTVLEIVIGALLGLFLLFIVLTKIPKTSETDTSNEVDSTAAQGDTLSEYVEMDSVYIDSDSLHN